MRRIIVVAAFAAFIVAVVTPAVAAAEKLWVSPSATVTGNGKSCTEPGFNAIQGAITKAGSGATIEVCSGTYTEQLTITNSVSLKAAGTPVVKLPALPASSTTTCAKALTHGPPGEEVTEAAQNEVEICGAVTVKISGVAINAAWPEGTCNDDLYGVFVGGGGTLSLSNSRILAAGAQPINGCQGGIGIEIGSGRTSPPQTGTATLSNVLVEGYQKNGINVIASGSKATLKKVTVKGAGPTSVIAQNGIEIGEGAEASVSKSSSSGNVYSPKTVASTGMLIFESSVGPTVTNSTFANNDVGLYYTESGTATLTVTNSKFLNSTYEGVFFEEGNAVLNKDTFNGGESGIGLYQHSGEISGPTGSGSQDKIENMSSYAVIGYSDKAGGDPPGKFTISNSKISNNPPGASVQHSVFSQSDTLEIVTEKDT
jgi:hypothetical protein